MTRLILASGSRTRRMLLDNAGLSFDVQTADVDERSIEAPLLEAAFPPDDIAAVLAEAKAVDVSERYPEALVIGADQTLGLGDRRFNKPADITAARKQLLDLRGQTHGLHSAVVCARDGEAIWRHVSTAWLTMRDFSPEYLGHYMAEVGDRVLESVGCYQLEGPGIQLFKEIKGDYFTILGLPLFPLLDFLRTDGVLEA
ncbi:Maf-like protein [Coralliovum pocilloporae]|uniref:Maf-like protein n=1 Tax=Coralliovum pocilloporae TaxID=3066369 RepID=UPI003307C5AD